MSNYKAETKKDLEKKMNAYKMVDVSQKLNLTPRAIRYYESEGLLGNIKRSIGFTRYFTDDDIHRLKEIKALKKKGHKIAQIKTVFSNKYPKDEPAMVHHLSIDSVFIEEKNIAACFELGITISQVTILINGVHVDYMNWRSLELKSYLAPFKLKRKQTPDVWRPKPPASWLGNGIRCLVNAALNHQLETPASSASMDALLNNVSEWLVLPIEIHSTGQFKRTLNDYCMIEQRFQGQVDRHMLPLGDALGTIEKQWKSLVFGVNGRVKHVTVHRKKQTKTAKKIEPLIRALVANTDRLSIEDLSPVYIQSLGTLDAVLISILT